MGVNSHLHLGMLLLSSVECVRILLGRYLSLLLFGLVSWGSLASPGTLNCVDIYSANAWHFYASVSLNLIGQ